MVPCRFLQVFRGLGWFQGGFMVFRVFWSVSMVFQVGFHGFSRWFHGFSWFLLDLNGFQGSFMVFGRFPCFFQVGFMVFGWFPWFQGSCMVLHGIAWYCMVLHGI